MRRIMTDRLKVSFVDDKPNSKPSISSKNARKQEIQATLERLWLVDPEQFNPNRDCMQRDRIKRTVDTISEYVQMKGKRVADLGCGQGDLSRIFRDKGAVVDALDAAGNALQRLKSGDMRDITAIQDCLPFTSLKDDAYDLVVCTEVIGYLKPVEYRLLISELSRVVKPDGFVVCSTPLDIDTENPLERFAALAETEFVISRWIFSHQYLLIKLCRFLEAPSSYVKANKDQEFRIKELEKRNFIGKLWFKMNCTTPLALLWKGTSLATKPILNYLRQSPRILEISERISNFIWSQSGISHALFIGKRRPLTFPLPADEIPREMKHKRQVWE